MEPDVPVSSEPPPVAEELKTEGNEHATVVTPSQAAPQVEVEIRTAQPEVSEVKDLCNAMPSSTEMEPMACKQELEYVPEAPGKAGFNCQGGLGVPAARETNTALCNDAHRKMNSAAGSSATDPLVHGACVTGHANPRTKVEGQALQTGHERQLKDEQLLESTSQAFTGANCTENTEGTEQIWGKQAVVEQGATLTKSEQQVTSHISLNYATKNPESSKLVCESGSNGNNERQEISSACELRKQLEPTQGLKLTHRDAGVEEQRDEVQNGAVCHRGTETEKPDMGDAPKMGQGYPVCSTSPQSGDGYIPSLISTIMNNVTKSNGLSSQLLLGTGPNASDVLQRITSTNNCESGRQAQAMQEESSTIQDLSVEGSADNQKETAQRKAAVTDVGDYAAASVGVVKSKLSSHGNADINVTEDRQGNRRTNEDRDFDDSGSSSSSESESDESGDSCSEDDGSAKATQSGVSDRMDNSSSEDPLLSETAAVLRDMDEEDGTETGPPRTKNEKDCDAIRIEKPKVQLKEFHILKPLGRVSGVMDKAVIVMSDAAEKAVTASQAAPGSSEAVWKATALDDGSVLWFEDRKMLGAVFETFGPVVAPFYIVRLNSKEEVEAVKAAVGRRVFYVDDMCSKVTAGDVHTKGYDSSNIFDEEAHGNQGEFSDDEAEAAAKRGRKRGAKQSVPRDGSGPPKRGRGGYRHGRGMREHGSETWQGQQRSEHDAYGRGRGRYHSAPIPRYTMQGIFGANPHGTQSSSRYGSGSWGAPMQPQPGPYNTSHMNPMGMNAHGASLLPPPSFPSSHGSVPQVHANNVSFNSYASTPYPHQEGMHPGSYNGWPGNAFQPFPHGPGLPYGTPLGGTGVQPPPPPTYSYGNQPDAQDRASWPGSAADGRYYPHNGR